MKTYAVERINRKNKIIKYFATKELAQHFIKNLSNVTNDTRYVYLIEILNIPEHVKHLENTISTLKDRIDTLESINSIQKDPFQKTICWVSDDFKIPTVKDSNGTRLIIEYDKIRKYPFKTADGSFWRYTTPLTTEEKLKYTLEEH